MNLDDAISSFLNSFVGKSYTVDEILTELLSGPMLTGAAYLSVVWFLWFENSDARDRVRLLIGVATAVAAALLGLALQLSLPFHARPLYDAALHLKWASRIGPGTLSHRSSFPSDHATIWFGLATVIFLHHRKIGAVAFVWTAILCACRVALGFHYASDIAGSAALGIIAVALSQRIPVTVRASTLLTLILEQRQAAFYLAAFLMSYELSVFFADFQEIVEMLMHKRIA